MALTNEEKIDLLGNNSYSAVVKEIVEKIQKAESDTLAGSELLKEVYANLNESITPLLTLKPFITGAEKIAGDDVKLKDLVEFLKKRITGNADLNFLINLVKEEHFSEMQRMSHPSPKSTVKDIEDQFSQPGSVIEEGIKAGVFDNLKSKLLNQIKSDLQAKTPMLALNESNALFTQNLVKYSPIGIKLEDIKNNRLLMLTENGVFSFNRETKEFSNLHESVEIPKEHAFLTRSINECVYSPENNTFSLNENWDFSLLLHTNGNVTVNKKDIPNKEVKALLLESIRAYVTDPTKVVNFNKMNYLRDADNFINLMENSSALIRLDTLQVLKNLNENTFVMFQTNLKTPKILLSSNNTSNNLFESFTDFTSEVNSIINGNIKPLFESQIKFEVDQINERTQKIQELTNAQQEINKKIKQLDELKMLAENDSPAMEKLMQQEGVLNIKLEENIKALNVWKNEFKLATKNE